MKKLNFLINMLFAISIVFLSSCEERIVSDYTPYEPNPNISLTYTDTTFFPKLEVLSSTTPVIVSEGVYSMKIDSVITKNGSFKFSNFSIDNTSGIISYDNTGNTLSPGDYTVKVILASPNSRNISEFKFTVEKVPVSLKASDDKVSVGVLEIADISTISYTDESPDQSITTVTYALQPEVKGYSIDENTGVINKNTEADGDTTVALGVEVTTNLGVRSFDSLVMVTVGPPPTIEYKQTDNTSKLNSVRVSPWTAYTTGTPLLNDMNADGGWELLVYDSNIDPAAFDIDQTTGQISILADQNLPIDTFMLGVKVTNGSGVPYTFDSLFTIYVNKDWLDADIVYHQDFNNAGSTTQNPEDYDPTYLKGYVLGSTSKGFKVKKWNITNKNSLFYAARILPADNDDINDVLLLKLPVQADWRSLRVSFKEFYGYGGAVFNTLQRTLSYGYDNSDLEGGSMNPANWNVIMAPDDPNWVTDVGWGDNKTDDDFTPVPYVELSGFDYTQTTVFINWNYVTQSKGQIYVDELKVQKSVAFPAEEQ